MVILVYDIEHQYLQRTSFFLFNPEISVEVLYFYTAINIARTIRMHRNFTQSYN